MRFVPIKTSEQQAHLGLRRARKGFAVERTAQANHFGALLAKFWLVVSPTHTAGSFCAACLLSRPSRLSSCRPFRQQIHAHSGDNCLHKAPQMILSQRINCHCIQQVASLLYDFSEHFAGTDINPVNLTTTLRLDSLKLFSPKVNFARFRCFVNVLPIREKLHTRPCLIHIENSRKFR